MKKLILCLCLFGGFVFADTHYTIMKYENFMSQKKIINTFIQTKQSFILTNVKKFAPLVEKIEELVENNNMTCRIYLKNRFWYFLAAAVFPPLGKTVGSMGITFILMHDLITFNPNYEIAKDYINDKLIVTYQY